MKYLNALNQIEGMGPKKMKQLISFFETGEKIWQATLKELLLSGVTEAYCQKIVEQRTQIDPDQEWQKLEKENVFALTMKDAAFPKLLKEIPDCPYLIYMKGDAACLDLPQVAIVGSRKLTSYGKTVAQSLAKDLARSGVCVVSGLAFGIDTCAHEGALETYGKTIAVLGNGLGTSVIAPHSQPLAQEILKAGGLLLSEFPIFMHASVSTFPMRNRIMAGMSLGTLVIEAADKSGSLITANLALDYNREVFAVPGPITSAQSYGTNKLIKEGAKLVTNADDIINELRLDEPKIEQVLAKKVSLPQLTEDEEKIYSLLSHESIHIDRITKLTKLDTSSVSSILAMLEIKNIVKNIGGQNYTRF